MSAEEAGGNPQGSAEEPSAKPTPPAADAAKETASAQTTPSTAASPSLAGDGAAARSAIEALERAYDEGRRNERPPLIASRLASGALFVLIVGFLGLILIELNTRFSSWDAFQPHVEAQIQVLGPRVTDSLQEVATELAPVYGRLAQERLKKSIPQLQAGAAKEWDELRQGLRVRTEGQVRDVMRRLEDRQWAKIREAFPSLHDPSAQTAFEERLRTQLQEEAEEVLANVHVRFTEDAKRLYLTMDGFTNPTLVAMRDDQLARHFVRLLLLLLDRKLLELDEGHLVATRDVRLPRATAPAGETPPQTRPTPAGSQPAPAETDEAPAETDEAPAETDEAPAETDEAPAETDEAPAETDESEQAPEEDQHD